MADTRVTRRVDYIPALRFRWLTALYDPVIRWTMRESTFKRRLVEQARLQKGHRVLDLGCGTATFTILLKQGSPDAEVVGVDVDPVILDIARTKAAQAGVTTPSTMGRHFNCLLLTARSTACSRAWCSII
ncbi:MAG: methyltransferase domain-containing protein [Nitrospirae bacterium]|nr:methyltransferase domain-containing protein [Nitrospirota bacterium]